MVRCVVVLGGTGEARQLAARSSRGWVAGGFHAGRAGAGAAAARRGGAGRRVRRARAHGRLAAGRTRRRRRRRHASVRRADQCVRRRRRRRSPGCRCCCCAGPAGPPATATTGGGSTSSTRPPPCCPTVGTRVFLTTGRQGLAAFARLGRCGSSSGASTRRSRRCPPACELLLSRGPYTVDGELALMREHRIDVLVTKDSGGAQTGPSSPPPASSGCRSWSCGGRHRRTCRWWRPSTEALSWLGSAVG